MIINPNYDQHFIKLTNKIKCFWLGVINNSKALSAINEETKSNSLNVLLRLIGTSPAWKQNENDHETNILSEIGKTTLMA